MLGNGKMCEFIKGKCSEKILPLLLCEMKV